MIEILFFKTEFGNWSITKLWKDSLIKNKAITQFLFFDKNCRHLHKYTVQKVKTILNKVDLNKVNSTIPQFPQNLILQMIISKYVILSYLKYPQKSTPTVFNHSPSSGFKKNRPRWQTFCGAHFGRKMKRKFNKNGPSVVVRRKM